MHRFAVLSLAMSAVLGGSALVADAATIEPGDLIVADRQALAGALGGIIQVKNTGAQIVVSPVGVNQFVDPVGVAFESNGNLIVVDLTAPTGGAGGVFRVDPVTGQQTVLSSGSTPGNRFREPRGVAIAPNGDIYVVDYNPASGAAGEIIRVDPVSGAQTLVTPLPSQPTLFVDPVALAFDIDGTLLVVDPASQGSGAQDGRLIRVDTTSGVQTSVAIGAPFVDPYGVAVAAGGAIYVTDLGANSGRGAVFQVDRVTFGRTVVLQGGAFAGPVAIAVAHNGELVVSDHAAFGNGGLIRGDPATQLQSIGFPNGYFNEPFGLAVAPGTPSTSGGLTVAGGMVILGDQTMDSATVLGGAALTVDGSLTITGDMTVAGLVNHSRGNLQGVRLNVAGRLWIKREATVGSINVTGQGLLGGHRGSPLPGGIACGETYDPVTGSIVCGSSYSSGGSYGGLGGTGSDPGAVAAAYGAVDVVNQLGGGGGAVHDQGGAGGNGGGLVRITAGTVTVDGEIRADAGAASGNCAFAYNNVGGGAGGGISIVATTFNGSSQGILSASGTNGLCNGSAAGGGGRIAIFADDQTQWLGTLTASGERRTTSAGDPKTSSPGTIFRRYSRNDSSVPGIVVLDNGTRVSIYYTPLRAGQHRFQSMAVRRGATLSVQGSIVPAAVVDSAVSVESGGALVLQSGAALTINRNAAPDLDVSGAGSTFNALTGTTLNIDMLRVQQGGVFRTEIPMVFGTASAVSLSGTSSQIQLRGASVFSIPAFDESNIQAGIFDIGPSASVQVASDAIRVGPGVTLVKDGRFAPNDEITTMTVFPGGRVTHYQHYPPVGCVLKVPGTLWIQRGPAPNFTPGQIDVSEQGLLGGRRTAPFEARPGGSCGIRGESYDPTTGQVICGPIGSRGGTYAGLGGTGASGGGPAGAYGQVESVDQVGGGGGAEHDQGNAGGNGGGLVRITAGTLIVDGEIRADGGTPTSGNCVLAYQQAGGGAGGGVSVSAAILTGGSRGLISANGGNGSICGGAGGGGGGRIVIRADDQGGWLGALSAQGGFRTAATNIASPGTIYHNTRGGSSLLGDLVLANGNRVSSSFTPLRSGFSAFRSILLQSGATLAPITPVTVKKLDVVSSSALGVEAAVQVDSILTVTTGGALKRP